MKLVVLIFLLFGITQAAAGEDLVECGTFNVAITNTLTVKVTGLEDDERVDQIEINYPDQEKWEVIDQERTVLRTAKLYGLSVRIDDGSKTKRLLIIDWYQFKDGGRVSASALVEFPNGDSELKAYTFCHASRI